MGSNPVRGVFFFLSIFLRGWKTSREGNLKDSLESTVGIPELAVKHDLTFKSINLLQGN